MIETKNNLKIINSDSFIESNNFEDNYVDCVITDSPYFIDKLDNHWSYDKIMNDKKNSHIKHLPKGIKLDKKRVKKFMIII